jgi:hypothetical protein
MNKPKITQNRIYAAMGVAVVADLLELPIAYIQSFHFEITFLMGEFLDIILDFVVMGIMTFLLGYNWAFLPSFFMGVVPELDLCPSWVASVAYVVWQNKKKEAGQTQPPSLLAAGANRVLEVVSETTGIKRIGPPTNLEPIENRAETQTPVSSTAEERLKNLVDLLDKNLISQNEFESKRQQILAGM